VRAQKARGEYETYEIERGIRKSQDFSSVSLQHESTRKNSPIPATKGEYMNKNRLVSIVIVFVLGLIIGLAIKTPVASLLAQSSASPQSPSSGTQSAQRTYEYRTFKISASDTKGLEKKLDDLGQQGFEVCGMSTAQQEVNLGKFNFDSLIIVLRRPKP
jgi:hypothetical protein